MCIRDRTWSGAAGDLFQVRRSFGSSTTFSSLATTTSNYYNDTAILPGSTYDYLVVRLSPSIAYSETSSAEAVSSFDANGNATSADGSVAVSLPQASSDRLAIEVAKNTAPPALSPDMSNAGSVYDVNATSLSSGTLVHRLDQPATLTFGLPAGITAAQAQGLAIFHFDELSGRGEREPTRLDWPRRQLIATVTHFSIFVVGTTSVTVTDDQAGATITVQPGGLGIQVSDDKGSPTMSFAAPTVSLEVDALTGNQTVVVTGILNFGTATFTIKVSDTQSDTSSTLITKTTHATVNVTGATITAGTVDIETSASVTANTSTSSHTAAGVFVGAPTLNDIINGTFLVPQNATVTVSYTHLTLPTICSV